MTESVVDASESIIAYSGEFARPALYAQKPMMVEGTVFSL